MNVIYDSETDILSLTIKKGKVFESDEDKKGVILDYDKNGNLMGIEILDASRKVPNFTQMNFEVRGAN